MLLLLGLILMGVLGDNDNSSSNSRKRSKKSYSRRSKRDDSWLDYAWFHDHNQNI